MFHNQSDISLSFIHRSTASWPLVPPKDEKQGWRHIRIQQMGKNASGQTHYLSLSGFEIYGSVAGVCDDLGKDKFVFTKYGQTYVCYFDISI